MTTLTLTVAATALSGAMLLADALTSPASGASATPAYKHYVACGLSRKATPSHACPKDSKKGAFFRSNHGDALYSVCVRFPTGKNICARGEEARQGTLYVNEITSNIPGQHKVTWFVKGERVGLYRFNVSG